MVEPDAPEPLRGFEDPDLHDAELLDALGDPAARADVERALGALAEALGEDDAAAPADPGLPEDYEVLGVLGQGAGGVVYRARQRSLEREVAVKLLVPRPDARGTERLFAEARRLAGLRHPGIVEVHEVGRARGGVYLTMELLGGGSLQDLLARGALNPGRAARLVRQAAEALAYTHGRGVVHLDLKPGNVLLDEEGEAHLADFGLARELGQVEHSASGGLVGTPVYMAPEQAADRRERLGERTDVYGLGALLHTCLTGAPPFAARSLADTLQAVRFEEPRSIRAAAPATPPDLIAIAAVAMAKDPAERYPTARALAQDLARYEAGEPVAARPPGGLRRFARRLRAHRRELASALGAMVLTALSLLAFVNPSRQADYPAWFQAIEELAARGEPRAAEVLVEHLRRRGRLAEDDLVRLEARRGAASGAGPNAKGPSPAASSVQRASAAEQDPAPEKDPAPRRRPIFRATRAPFDALELELDARDGLAAAVERASASPGPEELEAVFTSELWSWNGAFSASEMDEPGRARALVERLAALALPPHAERLLAAARAQLDDGAAPERIGVRVDTWIVLDDGGARRLWSGAGEGHVGEDLRLQGSAGPDPRLPRERAGFDLLRLAPAVVWPRREYDGRVEAEGRLERRAGGLVWALHDREVWLRSGGAWSAGFVRQARDGLWVGAPALLEAQRLAWAGGGATVLMFGEARVLDGAQDPPAEREYRDWARSLLEGALRDLEPERGAPAEPAPRAAALDRLIGAALCADGAGAEELRAHASRLAARGVDPAELSRGFFERGTFAGVTQAGADAAFWLELPASMPTSAPGPRYDRLPLTKSLERGQGRALEFKEWIWIAYVAIAVLLLAFALSRSRRSPARLAPLGLALLFSLLALEKSVLLPSGFLPLDGIGCALAALASVLLLPFSGRIGRWAALALGLAVLQELAAPYLPSSAPRLPLAAGLLALVFATRHLDPRGLAAFRRIAPVAFVLLYLATLLFPATSLSRFAFAHILALWTLWVLLVLANATATRARELRAARRSTLPRESPQ